MGLLANTLVGTLQQSSCLPLNIRSVWSSALLSFLQRYTWSVAPEPPTRMWSTASCTSTPIDPVSVVDARLILDSESPVLPRSCSSQARRTSSPIPRKYLTRRSDHSTTTYQTPSVTLGTYLSPASVAYHRSVCGQHGFYLASSRTITFLGAMVPRHLRKRF